MKNRGRTPPMSVFYIDPVGGHRGMHYYDFELCPALRTIGVDVTLLTCDETQNLISPAFLPIEYPFQSIYGSDSKIKRGLRYLQGLIKIGLAMGYRDIPLIHLHYSLFPPLDYLFSKWLRFRGRRIVFTAHDVTPFDAKSSDMSWFRRLYTTADAIITHANNNRDTLLEVYQIDPEKVHVVPMGPYLRFAHERMMPTERARQHLGLDVNSPVILFFGQIKKVKGLNYLIRAFQQVVEQFPTARLVIAGPEWKDSFASYAALIDELNLADKVLTRVEYVPDEDVGYYFSSANVVVLPYIEAYQSAVLYMAYSFGKPVIASAVGGLVEVVKDGVTGILVPSKDIERLVNALDTLLMDTDKAQAMGERGHILVKDEFGWESIAQKTAAIYSDALSR